jgi:hypothetical protein
MNGARGLTALRTEILVEVLRAVHRGSLPCPLTAQDLTRHGFQHAYEELSSLRDLDARAVTAVLVAVIAERQAAERARSSAG